jgi:hypothetical protein
MGIHDIHKVISYYPDVSIDDIKITWSMRQHKNHLKIGFKFCSVCNYLISTEETSCRICGKRFRMSTRNGSWNK